MLPPLKYRVKDGSSWPRSCDLHGAASRDAKECKSNPNSSITTRIGSLVRLPNRMRACTQARLRLPRSTAHAAYANVVKSVSTAYGVWDGGSRGLAAAVHQ